MNSPYKTREEALAAHQSKYFSGKPCSYGHVGDHWAATDMCCECAKDNVNKPTRRRRRR